MHQTIFGNEQEYGIAISAPTEEKRKEEMDRLYAGQTLGYGLSLYGPRGLGGFLENGGRLYRDNSWHPEYATPEAGCASDIVSYIRSGDRILAMIADGMNEGFFKGGVRVAFFVHNRDASGNVFGTHENYLMTRMQSRISLGGIAELMAPFFASRIIFTGNGSATPGGYHLSQRASATGHLVSEQANLTGVRGFISSRDEPHADRERWRRLHVIGADATMAETATFFRYGATMAVIELIEEEYLTKLPWWDSQYHSNDIIPALRHYTNDLTLRKAARLGHGYYSAADMQEFYYEKVARFSEYTGRTDEERKKLLVLWGDLIKRARSAHPEEALSPFVDWAAKMRLMKERGLWYIRSKRGGTLFPDDATCYRAQAIDIRYHDVGSHGLANILMSPTRDSRLWRLERMVTDQSIGEACRAPARDVARATRAYARAEQIKWIIDNVRSHCHIAVDWTSIKIHRNMSSGPFHTFSNPDPRRSDPHIPPHTEQWSRHTLIPRKP
ncbi:MAG: proteasome accessory factor PafA2 family protein [bacterium]|nr:proteasome accessory factor PafA2 family protein [bacterium]MDZ4300011.1 proteasome accessory factor PafA2 family protein [Candidatus Sungbacteria bacterium]